MTCLHSSRLQLGLLMLEGLDALKVQLVPLELASYSVLSAWRWLEVFEMGIFV